MERSTLHGYGSFERIKQIQNIQNNITKPDILKPEDQRSNGALTQRIKIITICFIQTNSQVE